MSAAEEVDKSVDEIGAVVPDTLRNGCQHAGNYTRRCGQLGQGVVVVSSGPLEVVRVRSRALETTLVSETAWGDAERLRVEVVIDYAIH
jgi:hypothetical protein